MNWFDQFMREYGVTILGTILTALAGYIGIAIKVLYEKICNDKAKKSIVKTCVAAIEQIYVDLHGAEKFDKCLEAASELLEDRGIKVSETELKMLIEAAVQQFNKAVATGNADLLERFSEVE